MPNSKRPVSCVNPEDDRLLSCKEVARYLGVCKRTVYRLDADCRPDREFPACFRIMLPGRKRPIRRWSLKEVLEYRRRRRDR